MGRGVLPRPPESIFIFKDLQERRAERSLSGPPDVGSSNHDFRGPKPILRLLRRFWRSDMFSGGTRLATLAYDGWTGRVLAAVV